MFKRHILQQLLQWKGRRQRKPLILRGARQTGKTKVVEQFAAEFSGYAYLNLEHEADRRIFAAARSVREVIHAIEVVKQVRLQPGDTLLFLDEIQNSPQAVAMLRYFYEQYPDLHVIAAGSLLEAIMQKDGFAFPVGRVEFLYVYPATFDEFLGALGEAALQKALAAVTPQTPLPEAIHEHAMTLFEEYLVVGGMPEVVAAYAATRSLFDIGRLQEGLLTALEEDVHKYSRTAQVPRVRHVLQTVPLFVGQRITYEHFGESTYRSREIKQAMEVLEYAMVMQRVYGSHTTSIPIQPVTRVAPKLLYLDVGLVAHRFNVGTMRAALAGTDPGWKGALMEQVVGQELLALSTERRNPPCFWYRQQPGATAEVDYCLPWREYIVPIEVKSGKVGHLKSLHQFMAAAPHPFAVRVNRGPLNVELLSVAGKSLHLLNVPLYLVARLPALLDGLQ